MTVECLTHPPSRRAHSGATVLDFHQLPRAATQPGRYNEVKEASITGSPVIGGGRIWALDTNAGVLYALDPSTGKSLSQVNVGVANRFATPALYGGDVIMPTLAGITVVRTS